ncbi:MAG: anti-sigma factor antagonist [Anaerolineales bacterium]|nr:anti-sigma factor antagonist [Anaerolineales bacterium]
MEINIVQYRRVAVITVSGRIDTATSPDFEESVNGLINKGDNNLVMDFSEVEFLSSSGLRILVTTRKKVRERGGDVVLANPSQRVVDSLEIAGLDKLFKSYPDRESAIASF